MNPIVNEFPHTLCEMVSATDLCKRALVTLLHALARACGCAVNVTRDSPDAVVKRAYRTVSKKTRPDRGGESCFFLAVLPVTGAQHRSNSSFGFSTVFLPFFPVGFQSRGANPKSPLPPLES